MSEATKDQEIGPVQRILFDEVEHQRSVLSVRQMAVSQFLAACERSLGAPTKTGEKLRECSPASLRHSVRKAAEMGLLPNGEDGALVPFKTTATFIPMVSGLKRLLWEGEHAEVLSGVIYEVDEYKVIFTDNGRRMDHQRKLGQAESPKVIAAYCEIKFPGDSEWSLTLVDKHEIERARQVSPGSEGTFWTKFYDRMADKTAVRLACYREKHRIKSLGMLAFLEQDVAADPEDDPNTITVSAMEVPTDAARPAGAGEIVDADPLGVGDLEDDESAAGATVQTGTKKPQTEDSLFKKDEPKKDEPKKDDYKEEDF